MFGAHIGEFLKCNIAQYCTDTFRIICLVHQQAKVYTRSLVHTDASFTQSVTLQKFHIKRNTAETGTFRIKCLVHKQLGEFDIRSLVYIEASLTSGAMVHKETSC